MMEVYRGTVEKNYAAAKVLEEVLRENVRNKALLYLGYPIVSSQSNKSSVDALLIDENLGLVIFDLVDGELESSREAERDGLLGMFK